MSTKEGFKQKIDAEVARAEAILERFTALGMGLTAAAKIKHDGYVEELEQKVDGMKAGLREFVYAEDDVWEGLQDSLMIALAELQAALQHAIETFTFESPASGPHGNDDGDYLYGFTGRRKTL